jgi:hypothetical protein
VVSCPLALAFALIPCWERDRMAAPQPAGPLERQLAPWPLLLGVAASFLACCAAGAWCGRRNLYDNFERFHPAISPEWLHCPTPSQVLALARARLPRDKVAVIVGGNSILHGVGQRPEWLWTKALQAALGDDYRVLNLAMRGASASEFGGAVAEAFSREHPRVIFVTLAGYGGAGRPDGDLYRYFYWGAFARGMLLPSPERDERLRAVRELDTSGKCDELKRQGRLNCYGRFNDLWNALAYRRLSTVWASPVADHPFRARKHFSDLDPGPAVPLALRCNPAYAPAIAQRLRGWLQAGRVFLPLEAPAGQGPPGLDVARSEMARQLRACFPEPCRPRTLVLVPHESPYRLRLLSPEEQATCRQLVVDQARTAECVGFAALAVGRDYTDGDYYDSGGHYSEQGGARLAGDVAAKVREMARRLGYLQNRGPP